MKTLKQKYNSLRKRIWNSKVYNYEYNFCKAISNTKKLGLKPIDDFENEEFRFSLEDREEIINIILHQVYSVEKLQIEDLALKCFLISNQLQIFLRKYFEIDSIITTGNIYINKLQIHYEKYSMLKQRLNNPNFNEQIKFHTWLTLKNLDVIDLTLAPNIWFDHKLSGTELKREDYEKIAWVETKDTNRKGVIYEPKILGYEYLEKINKPIKLYGWINN